MFLARNTGKRDGTTQVFKWSQGAPLTRQIVSPTIYGLVLWTASPTGRPSVSSCIVRNNRFDEEVGRLRIDPGIDILGPVGSCVA
jgi:hypothetical protein